MASLIQQRLAQEEREPYAKAVIAKGLSRRQFYLRHLSRPCLEVTVSILPLWWGLFFGASLVVEPIFRIQGLGFLAVEAFRNQDLPILIGITLVIGGGRIILSNLRELALLLFFPSRKYGHST
ncbi:MAG: ABC transporter permease subunit [Proteobacteria bacterium]|nr:ABC transporter permease subunit [Pseudomonadota bacterium]